MCVSEGVVVRFTITLCHRWLLGRAGYSERRVRGSKVDLLGLLWELISIRVSV